jgi:lipopolysaccharide assembly protein A
MAVLLVVIVLVAGLVIFSVQNASPVSVAFLIWHFDASLAIVVFLALIAGIIIMAVISSVLRLRRHRRKLLGDERFPEDREASRQTP